MSVGSVHQACGGRALTLVEDRRLPDLKPVLPEVKILLVFEYAAAAITGGTGVGAIIGTIVGKGRGAAIGAVLGRPQVRGFKP